ncbi:hypothetical protein GLOIN_2v1828688 [Rhizophagus clarus]|uniref:Uncharacterized protein n=1 Tax=Rhizophagus clarus TaxID=94130 RepID=A0A8H3LXY9_9GLOM|nr:hypothetical protein GLOIN_2v1828688 [Rhizophagus clarus]
MSQWQLSEVHESKVINSKPENKASYLSFAEQCEEKGPITFKAKPDPELIIKSTPDKLCVTTYFLEECSIEEFKQKIEACLTSLKAIADTQEDIRGERAKVLLDKYKKAIFGTSHEANAGAQKIFGISCRSRLWVNLALAPLGRRKSLGLADVQDFGSTLWDAISDGKIRDIKSVNESQAEPNENRKENSSDSRITTLITMKLKTMTKPKIDLIRGEGSSTASSDRKNDDMNCEENRKKIGRKGDGIFRLIGDRLEFGAIEAGRKWEGKSGRKYIKDSLKLNRWDVT